MSPEPILPVQLQIVSLCVLLAFSGWVMWLIRSQRLQLRESLIWLLTTIAAMAVTAFPQVLVWASRLLGVHVPANALFGAGLFYVTVNVLSVTIGVSGNTMKLRRLAQECALLRAQLAELRGAPPAPGGEAAGRRDRART